MKFKKGGPTMYNLDDIEYNVIRTNEKYNKKNIEYLNLECAFDIETTSAYTSDGKKFAFMYVWTFGLKDENHIIHGRTWEEFIKLCEYLQEHFKLSESRRLICYVHNLEFEFQFMRKYFKWVDVFSPEERKPIKAVTSYGIEFRDSYILSGLSLENTAKNLTEHTIKKMVGNLDYELIRHSKTPLTKEEMEYIINDVVIILYYINEQIKLYGDISKIPLTNTGRVRRFVRDRCYYTNKNHSKSSAGKYRRYRQIMEDLTLTKEVYLMLVRAFMGGFTHANANYTGKILENVTSIDFTSSYPAVMLSEKFPMSKPIKTELTKEKDFEYYNQRYGLLFNIRFTNLISKIPQENYISASKCWDTELVQENNGRVYRAKRLTTTITNIDFEIIKQCYTWDKAEISDLYRFHMGYLPKSIIESIIELYKKKTVLKGVEGYEAEYLLSKGMLNSIYGMAVTRIVRDEIKYNDDWTIESADIDKQIKEYNKSKNRFLYYPWGVWVTAYARRNLWYGIISMGEDYVYSDTDSIKFLNYEKHRPFIEKYNKHITAKVKRMCEYYNIDYEKELLPKTKDGKVKPIGVFEIDGHYKRFKTLGAKRYLVEYENGEMEMTVAGLSKKNGLKYLQKISKDNTEVFNNFNDEMYIPAEYTGKMTHTYLDEAQEHKILDYLGNEGVGSALSAVHLEKADFTLSLARQYVDFIENLQKGYIYTGLDYL